MKRRAISLLFWTIFTAFLPAEALHAQGTAFVYQGRLNDGGSPANGNYDLRFALYDAVVNGNMVSSAVTNSPTVVSNGLFLVTLNFGPGVFTGLPRWLDIGVRTNGSTSAYTVLSPRQALTPVPYAIFANTASNLAGSLPAVQLVGTLPASAFAGYTNTVALTNGGNLFAGVFNGTFGGAFNGAFFGNGGGVTNVNVTNLTGVLADNQLPSNTAFVNSNQTFSGANSFTGTNSFANRGNSFVGSFFGNGLVGWLPTNGTAIQAVIDTGYLLTNSQLATVTLPASPNPGDIVRIAGAGAGGWMVAQNANQAVFGSFLAFANSSWTVSGAISTTWSDIAASADGSKMVASASGSGGIYTSMDSGRTWGQTSASAGNWTAVASSADGSKLAATRSGSTVYTSTNSGGTWVQRTSVLPSTTWSAIASSANGSNLVATVGGGFIYKSSDSGANWSQTSAPNSTWTCVASSADGTRLAASSTSGIYISSDSGNSWPSSVGGSWAAVTCSADGTKLVAAQNSGSIYTSTNAGSSWIQRTGAPSTTWTSVASSADGGKLVATVGGGGIYTSLNYGATWTQQFGAPSTTWKATVSSADGRVLAAVINNGGIYTIQASSSSLTTVGTAGGITGGPGTAVELQYVGNNLFMPVSSAGIIWGF